MLLRCELIRCFGVIMCFSTVPNAPHRTLFSIHSVHFGFVNEFHQSTFAFGWRKKKSAANRAQNYAEHYAVPIPKTVVFPSIYISLLKPKLPKHVVRASLLSSAGPTGFWLTLLNQRVSFTLSLSSFLPSFLFLSRTHTHTLNQLLMNSSCRSNKHRKRERKKLFDLLCKIHAEPKKSPDERTLG